VVLNATFNNNSVISWRSVLLVEETGVPGENHRPAVSQRQTLSHKVASSAPRLSLIRSHNTLLMTTHIKTYTETTGLKSKNGDYCNVFFSFLSVCFFAQIYNLSNALGKDKRFKYTRGLMRDR